MAKQPLCGHPEPTTGKPCTKRATKAGENLWCTTHAETVRRKAEFLAFIEDHGPNKSAACRELGISRGSLFQWFESDPQFVAALDAVRESLVDEVRQFAYEVAAGRVMQTKMIGQGENARVVRERVVVPALTLRFLERMAPEFDPDVPPEHRRAADTSDETARQRELLHSAIAALPPAE